MLQGSTAVAAGDNFWNELNPLLDAGIRVIPIEPSTRKPFWQGWEFGKIRMHGSYGSSATTDRERLLRITESALRPGIAAPQGQPLGNGYSLVVDVDAENGGLDSWVDLCGRLGEPPPTATVLTKTESCFHKWFVSSSQWTNAPKELGPGVEVKRSGQLTMVPPTEGYVWARAPWDDLGVWRWNELDAYLGMIVGFPTVAERSKPAIGVPRVAEWTSVDDHLRAIAGAKPGQRHDALLRYGGKVAYATAIGHGLESPQAVWDALWRACRTNGLAKDYPEEEVGRKIEVYARWALPGENPIFRKKPVLRPGGAEGGIKVMTQFRGRGSRAEQAVFTDLVRLARHDFKPYPIRWAMKSTGLAYNTVRDALERLQTHKLIEKGPSISNDGKRATHTYRLTAKGRALLVYGWVSLSN